MANKPGNYLAALTKRIHAKPVIILKDTKALIRNNNVIHVNLKCFYEQEYKSELNSGMDPVSFLDSTTLEQLSADKKMITKNRDHPRRNIRYR
jgi:hypothetical protein